MGPYKVDRSPDPQVGANNSRVIGPNVCTSYIACPEEIADDLNAAYAAGAAKWKAIADACYDELPRCGMFDMRSGSGCGECPRCKAVEMYMDAE